MSDCMNESFRNCVHETLKPSVHVRYMMERAIPSGIAILSERTSSDCAACGGLECLKSRILICKLDLPPIQDATTRMTLHYRSFWIILDMFRFGWFGDPLLLGKGAPIREGQRPDLSKNHHPFGTLAPLAAARDTRPTVARGRKTTKYLSLQHAINKNETKKNGPKTLKK